MSIISMKSVTRLLPKLCKYIVLHHSLTKMTKLDCSNKCIKISPYLQSLFTKTSRKTGSNELKHAIFIFIC